MNSRTALPPLALALLVFTGCPSPDEPAPAPPGPELSIEPACVELGGDFTARATGLQPGGEYGFLIEPLPHPELEPGAMAVADDQGTAELPGRIPEDAEPGQYTWSVAPLEEDDELASARFAVAEECP